MLKKLEYRGYDSAGLAIYNNQEISIFKQVGNVETLEKSLIDKQLNGKCGIGHTRWATHGIPTQLNAHPFKQGKVSLVHNGIIENFQEIKEMLFKQNYQFQSQTDSEVLCALVDFNIKQQTHLTTQNIVKAIQQTLKAVQGSYSFAFIIEGIEPSIFAACHQSPLVVFKDDDKNVYLASDQIAFNNLSGDISIVQDGQIVVLQQQQIQLYSKDDKQLNVINQQYQHQQAQKQNINKQDKETYMYKEIYEQPEIIEKTIKYLQQFVLKNQELITIIKNSKFVTFIGCGTSYHAGVVGSYYLEQKGICHSKAEIASEFLYKQPFISDVYIFLSQSGETRDTVNCLDYIKQNNNDAISIALVNVQQSQLARKADYTCFTQCGSEIGVASTKSFTSQVLTLISLINYVSCNELFEDQFIQTSKNLMQEIDIIDQQCQKYAYQLLKYKSLFYLGRNMCYPLAMEGSLKMKEITYIHSEAYPSGELKHGPLALIDENFHTIVSCLNNDVQKLLSTINEILARKGTILIIANEDIINSIQHTIQNTDKISIIKYKNDNFNDIFYIIIAYQLLAYYTARYKQLNIDQPRNLAKCVTVE